MMEKEDVKRAVGEATDAATEKAEEVYEDVAEEFRPGGFLASPFVRGLGVAFVIAAVVILIVSYT
jgi:hypothetical protein